MGLHGRRKILTDEAVITRENVLRVLEAALVEHGENAQEIDQLWSIYNGKQAILNRKKKIRPEICNNVVENHAREIVEFKLGYLMGEPVQYVCRVDGSEVSDEINRLNEFMASEEKAAKDHDISEWNHVCGTAYRMVLPDPRESREQDEAPFEIYTLDPRSSFVVYLNDLGEPPVMGVRTVVQQNGTVIHTCYTDGPTFRVSVSEKGEEIEVLERSPAGIPIIEYPLNNSRMGAFEPVLPLLDAINAVQSNRLDGLEQFVQALLVFHNVNIDEETYAQLREEGGIKIKDSDPSMPGEIKYLVEQLSQADTQTVMNDLYERVLLICGMPNRNGGSSTSDTGSAVIMRDGWSAAETRAKAAETMFKRSEREFLKKVIKICADLSDLTFRQSSIDIRFTRRNYENIAQKANVLTTMLSNDKIDPLLAFSHCGMFADPETAYQMSKSYYEKREKEIADEERQAAEASGGSDGTDPVPREPRRSRPDEGKNRGLGSKK